MAGGNKKELKDAARKAFKGYSAEQIQNANPEDTEFFAKLFKDTAAYLRGQVASSRVGKSQTPGKIVTVVPTVIDAALERVAQNLERLAGLRSNNEQQAYRVAVVGDVLLIDKNSLDELWGYVKTAADQKKISEEEFKTDGKKFLEVLSAFCLAAGASNAMAVGIKRQFDDAQTKITELKGLVGKYKKQRNIAIGVAVGLGGLAVVFASLYGTEANKTTQLTNQLQSVTDALLAAGFTPDQLVDENGESLLGERVAELVGKANGISKETLKGALAPLAQLEIDVDKLVEQDGLEDLAKWCGEAVSALEQLGNIRQDVSDMLDSMGRSLDEFKTLDEAVAFLGDTVPGLVEEYNKAQTELGTLRTDLETAQRKLAEAQGEVERLEKLNTTLWTEYRDFQTAHSGCEGTINDLRTENDTLRGDVSRLETENKTLESERDTARNDYAQSQQDLQQAQSDLATAQDAAKKAEDKVKDLEGQVSYWKDKAENNSAYKDEYETALKLLETAQQERDQANADRDAAITDKVAAEQECDQAKADLETAQQELASERAANQQKITEYEQKIADNEAKIAELEGELASLNQQLQQKAAQLLDLQNQIDDLQRENAALRALVNSLDNELQNNPKVDGQGNDKNVGENDDESTHNSGDSKDFGGNSRTPGL